MRTREEIIEDLKKTPCEFLELEVLLDIRDLFKIVVGGGA